MSDPVTNVEIEDVLSSIRRLVSDGDKARTRDPAPVAEQPDQEPEVKVESDPAVESKTERFVLTPALMIVANDADEKTGQDETGQVSSAAQPEGNDEIFDEDDQDAGWVEELPDEPERAHDDVVLRTESDNAVENTSDLQAESDEADTASENFTFDAGEVETDYDDTSESGPVEDDDPEDMVWGSVDEARKIGLAAVPEAARVKADIGRATDRSDLIASIAELEAAVSKDVHDFEPDGSEDTDMVMGETIAWPGTIRRNTDSAQDAEEAGQPDMDLSAEDQNPAEAEEPAELFIATAAHRAEIPQEVDQETSFEPSDDNGEDESDDYGDDDLDGLPDTGAINLDEDALRALVSEIVREELTGPMGERITRNVRKLVRREIYRILSTQDFD